MCEKWAAMLVPHPSWLLALMRPDELLLKVGVRVVAPLRFRRAGKLSNCQDNDIVWNPVARPSAPKTDQEGAKQSPRADGPGKKSL